MTQKVQAGMMLGNGVIRYDVGLVASGDNLLYYPLISTPRPLEITEFKHFSTAIGNPATISLEVGTIGGSFTEVDLDGTNTPNLTTTLSTATADDSVALATSSTRYVAAGESIVLRIDNSAAGTTDATNIRVEIYATVTDVS